jgi:hypothetical protein
MADNTPTPAPSDEEAVLSLQEIESDQEEVHAHISTFSLMAGSC